MAPEALTVVLHGGCRSVQKHVCGGLRRFLRVAGSRDGPFYGHHFLWVCYSPTWWQGQRVWTIRSIGTGKKGVGVLQSQFPQNNGSQGPSEGIECLLITESRCHAFGSRVLASPCVGSGAVVERGVTSISPGVRSSSCPDPF